MNPYLQLFQNQKHPLIMSLPQNKLEWANAAMEAGADAVKVHVNLLHHASNNKLGGVEAYRETFDGIFRDQKVPIGVVLGNDPGMVRDTFRETLEYPFDFISLYAHHVPLDILALPQAKMIACGSQNSLEEISQFRCFHTDVLEASVVPGDGYGQPLQMMDLIHYRQIVEISQLPVVVPTQRAIRPSELGKLFEAGVQGIMIGAIVTGETTKGIADTVAAFRKEIDKLEGN